MFRSLATVGSLTFVSRILGFARDLVLAHTFGAGAATDAFFVAFKIPNFFRRLFAEGAFANAFVPVLSEYREQRGQQALRDFVDHMAGMLSSVLLVITLLGVLGAPLLMLLFAPGFSDDSALHALGSEMLRLTFPYLMLISLTAFLGAILNTHGRFGPPALAPALLNLALIGCALWLAPRMQQPIVALAWGVLFAGIAQLSFQLPYVHSIGLLPRPRLNRQHSGVSRVLRLMVPALFGVSVTQISLLLDTLLASFLQTGSISWLYYSDRLMEFPLGILGVALGTVILPALSRDHSADSPAEFSRTVDWALRWVLFLGLPSALGLMLLAGPIIATLFLSEVFDAQDARMASHSLIAYSLGLLSFIAIKILAPCYFARQDTRTPVRIAIRAMLATIVLNLLLIWPLAHVGLALATALGASLNAGLLYHGLRRDGIYQPGAGWQQHLLRALVASLAMAAILLWLSDPLESWLSMSGSSRALQLVLIILAAASVYLATLAATGLRPAHILHR